MLKEELELKIELDEATIMNFMGIVTQNSIVELAKTVEATLIDFGEDETKVRAIFEIIVEVMQNILNYSYDTVDVGNNTYRSKGRVKIALKSKTHTYNVESGNLININKKDAIMESIDYVNSLDADTLKEVYKERRRSRRKNHERGAGLGFLDMARKSKNKLSYEFTANDDNKDSLIFELYIKI